MMNTGTLAVIVAATGMAAWTGSIVGRWWDLLAAWLIWGTVVLVALIYELRRNNRAASSTHVDTDTRADHATRPG
jgi:hypothetical protein